jgi:prolyl oligopeptidase
MTSTPSQENNEEDPYIWLEDVEAEKSLDFAKEANEKCLKALGDPKEGSSYQRILDVLESKDRIPHAFSHGTDKDGNCIVLNFWKDATNPKGILRRTTLQSYKNKNSDAIKWTTVLNVDELAEKDGISWVWKGSKALARRRDPLSEGLVTRCLMSLSRGGSDATHLKEFDMISEEFVTDQPFNLPEAKTRAGYKSRDILLVGSDFGPGSLTDSGYPRVIKEWARGTNIEDAPIVFEGEATDVSVSGYVADERPWGGSLWQIHSRSITFYTSRYWVAKLTPEHLESPQPEGLPEPEFKELQLPEDASLDYTGNLLIVSLRSDWTPKTGGVTYKRGSVIYCPFETFWAEGKEAVDYQILFEPTDRTAYEYFTCTKNYLILSSMDTVKSKLQFYKIGDNGNSLDLIYEDKEAKIRSCNVRPLDPMETDDFWFTTSDYVTPSTLYLADASKVETTKEEDAFISEKLRTLPPQYDSSNLIVEQQMATSKDGTQIPYFIVKRKDIEYNGKNPTLLYGYGGFEISLGPHYIATSGLAWLERGGVYVEANIRGGGEFGPAWHQAALKANRNKAYEDFIAVGEHLIETNICKPKTLGIRGGSNGTYVV